MTTYHIEPERRTLHGHFSGDLTPVLTIESGDTVVFRTLEAGWNRLPRPGLPFAPPDGSASPFVVRRDPEDSGHALCGPVAIRGAQPGMTLEIRIDRIVPGAWGWTIAGGWPHEVNARLGMETTGTFLQWTIHRETRTARDQKGRTVRIRPFAGVMGMPPNAPGIHSTAPPRATGGNLDCKELIEGTRLFLPVAVVGGLFSVGDGHAAQGDGESSFTAIECPFDEVALTFRLHPDLAVTTPRAETGEGWLTFGLSEDLNEATFRALDAMLDLMIEHHPALSRPDALALASVVVDLRVTQIVNGVKGVHAVLPHGAIQFDESET